MSNKPRLYFANGLWHCRLGHHETTGRTFQEAYRKFWRF